MYLSKFLEMHSDCYFFRNFVATTQRCLVPTCTINLLIDLLVRRKRPIILPHCLRGVSTAESPDLPRAPIRLSITFKRKLTTKSVLSCHKVGTTDYVILSAKININTYVYF